jgi:MHS family proline/betaine transporter-like MFS transporter
VAEHPNSPSRLTFLGANLVGNILEWYDFALYGSFATLFSKLFFPHKDPFLALLETFGAFAIGYVTRPLGGIVFGHIGDTKGRKTALIVSILLMSLPTFLVGLLPTYDAAGYLSPLLLVVLRILQGIAIGGEFTLAMSFLVETAASDRRGYQGSYAMVGVVGGILMGTIAALVVAGSLSPEHFQTWGWRLPFLSGLLLLAVGILLRRHLPESPAFERRTLIELPFVESIRLYRNRMLQGFGFLVTNSVAFYLIVVYQPSYLSTLPQMNLKSALFIQVLSLVLLLFLIPFGGLLSDLFGRKPVTLTSVLGFLFLSYPVYRLFQNGSPAAVFAGQSIFVALLALYIGPLPSIMAEIFPSRVRCSALSVTYNTNLAIFGGTTPLAATFLIHRFQTDSAPGAYLATAALLSFITLLILEETRHRPMH